MTATTKIRPQVYYGWYIVATVTFIAFIAVGTSTNFGIFVIPMSQEFGWSRAAITGVSFLCHQIGGLSGVLLGGFLYDLTGTYTLSFAIVGSMLFPAALSAFTINERKYSTRYRAQLATVANSGN